MICYLLYDTLHTHAGTNVYTYECVFVQQYGQHVQFCGSMHIVVMRNLYVHLF